MECSTTILLPYHHPLLSITDLETFPHHPSHTLSRKLYPIPLHPSPSHTRSTNYHTSSADSIRNMNYSFVDQLTTLLKMLSSAPDGNNLRVL